MTVMMANPTETRADRPVNRPRGPYLKTDRDSFLGRLHEGIRAARERLGPFHRQRVAAIREWCGPRYGMVSEWTDEPLPGKPLATLFSYFAIVMPTLAARRLVVKGVGKYPWYDGLAVRLAALTGMRLDELDAAATVLEPVIADTLFGGWGVSKVGVEVGSPGGEEPEDWLLDPGEPYWSRVSPERYLFDPHCTNRRSAQWEGDEFFIGPYELERKYGVAALAAMEGREVQQLHKDDSTESISDKGGIANPLYPMYRLAEVWLPREGAILTVPADDDDWTGDSLDERGYKGPEGGPYDMLAFERPPDNPLGVSIISQLMDMDELINAVMSKVAWRVENRKDVTVVSPGNTKTGYGVRDARDGEILEGDPSSVNRLSFGGADAADWNAINQLQKLMNYYAGNPEVVGGLAADAKTLGQDQLKFQNAATKLGRWAGRAMAYANRCIRRVAWFQAIKPMVEDDGSLSPELLEAAARAAGAKAGPVEIPVNMPGVPKPVMTKWTPIDSADAEANFLDLNLTLDAYAAADLSPEQEYQATKELAVDVVLPMMPALAQQGVQVDVGTLIAELAEKRNLRGTYRWFKTAPPQQLPQPPGQQQAGDTTNISVGTPPRGRPMQENPTMEAPAAQRPTAQPQEQQ